MLSLTLTPRDIARLVRGDVFELAVPSRVTGLRVRLRDPRLAHLDRPDADVDIDLHDIFDMEVGGALRFDSPDGPVSLACREYGFPEAVARDDQREADLLVSLAAGEVATKESLQSA